MEEDWKVIQFKSQDQLCKVLEQLTQYCSRSVAQVQKVIQDVSFLTLKPIT